MIAADYWLETSSDANIRLSVSGRNGASRPQPAKEHDCAAVTRQMRAIIARNSPTVRSA